MQTYDVLIRNAKVLDGMGNEAFDSDIGIEGDTIRRIGRLDSARAGRTIDASGLYVAPGFIDMHTHSGMTYPANRRAESAVRQGVTTMVIGNCGISVAPLEGESGREIRAMAEMAGLEAGWRTFTEYDEALLGAGVAANYVHLLGHGTLRDATMGRTDRAPGREEIKRMRDGIDRAFDQGVFGLSSGLIYPPGNFTGTNELVELCRPVAARGGLYATHIRGEGETLLEAVSEAIAIGERTGAPVQISHLKVSGRRYWDSGPRALELIDHALDRGLDVAADMYPYLAGHTGLQAILPHWVHDRGNEVLLQRLKDPGTRERIKGEMMRSAGEFSIDNVTGGWDGIIVGLSPGNPEYQGRSIGRIADELGKDPIDVVMDAIVASRSMVFVNIMTQCEDNVRLFLQHPRVMIGSDSYAVAPYGVLGGMRPHPRTYGTFPRVLGEYVRERNILSLTEAVRKMTSLPASRLGLGERGAVAEGKKADLVIFNAGEIRDCATYEDPHRYPCGIRAVLVNGDIVVDGGEHTGALPGTVLRKTSVESSAG